MADLQPTQKELFDLVADTPDTHEPTILQHPSYRKGKTYRVEDRTYFVAEEYRSDLVDQLEALLDFYAKRSRKEQKATG